MQLQLQLYDSGSGDKGRNYFPSFVPTWHFCQKSEILRWEVPQRTIDLET